MQLTLRREKGSPLTIDEVDDNFANLKKEIEAATSQEQIDAAIDNYFADVTDYAQALQDALNF